MNALHRKTLENLVEVAIEKVADETAWENWGPSDRARASYAQALLAHDALLRLARAAKPAPVVEPSRVVQAAVLPPVVEKPAESAGDAGSSPAPAAKPQRVRKQRRRRG